MKLKQLNLPSILAGVSFVLLWELVVTIFSISPIVFPPFHEVVKAFWLNGNSLLINSFVTLIEAIAGFILGLIIACLTAAAFHFSPLLKRAFHSYIVAFRSIPIIALAPLVILWFGTGYTSKIILAAIISFFPILVNLLQGIEDETPKEALELFKTFSATKWQTFYKVHIPYSLPTFFSGCKTASSFAVIGTIVAEFVGSQDGIGYLIKSSTYYNSTDLTFASILCSALIGVAFFEFVALLGEKVVFWKRAEQRS